MKPICIVDVDETLWNSSIVMYNTARALGYEFPVPSDWTHWNIFWEYVPKEKMFPVFDAVHSAQNNHPPYLEAEDFLNFMKEKFGDVEYKVIGIRPGEAMRHNLMTSSESNRRVSYAKGWIIK